ncbi:HNH/ENDO VII family nuclease [Streptomyces hyaluromycini]|uniref:HNH/ENDO VII family nuclease n=1 Tax=Streptomyces hyaluromycini TaxID=1377993 RepID=UPI00142E3997|nr:HNH/ENDO VII family nuclease [Streptomyces hyaluromycini]
MSDFMPLHSPSLRSHQPEAHAAGDRPHGSGQDSEWRDGPIAEVTDAMHFDNYGELHWKSGTKIPSGIDRPEFEKRKKAYGQNRAKDFE